ncbi:uncharacterized protein LOC125680252 [Ostrea edulis]|uniref:uncharacterized protein LOC125680252 n=1 Tax=Ostrea edulis TaxID=37623 RepID=UPI0024AFA3E3|nr:uncharacterized protein LOC125680252 [Ostrea edulis]
MPPSKIFFLLWSLGLVVHTVGYGHGIGDLFRLITGPRRAECLHTAALIELWNVRGHSKALQTLYEYIVVHISTPGKPCCIPGFISDPLEAYVAGVWFLPNVPRMKERIQYSCPECKEYLVTVMESTCGIRHVPHVKHYFTTGNPMSSTHHHVHHTTTPPPGAVTQTTTTHLQRTYAECQHTGDLLTIWLDHKHYIALQMIYEYIVAHISDKAMPCCIPGSYSSYNAEALLLGQLPNMGRLEERIRYADPLCKEILATTMEEKGIRRVPHVNHYYTTPKYVSTTHLINHSITSKATTILPTAVHTTTPTTTTPQPTTTTPQPTTTTLAPTTTTTKPTTITVQTTQVTSPGHTNQNKTITGVRCPSCDMNLNCVWNNVCVSTQSCLVRSYPGYPFSTHCAEKGDCLLMKQLAPNGEIFCCDDENCLHKILGV